MKLHPTQNEQRNARNLAAADDLAVAILQDRIDDASKCRQLQAHPLSIQEVARLRQHGALN